MKANPFVLKMPFSYENRYLSDTWDGQYGDGHAVGVKRENPLFFLIGLPQIQQRLNSFQKIRKKKKVIFVEISYDDFTTF